MMKEVTLQLEDSMVRIAAGELVGYQKEGHEFIHQKGSPGWGSSDTEMFPIIGPTNEAGYMVQVIRGTAVQDQHGLLRELEYELLGNSATTASFVKRYKAGTAVKNSKFPERSAKQWLVWPYDFEFHKQFQLSEEGLEVIFTIKAEKEMPYMLGYHPAFAIHGSAAQVQAGTQTIPVPEVMEVGNRAMHLEGISHLVLEDGSASIVLEAEGFEGCMLWSPTPNMICMEPVTYYPYALPQSKLHEGFRYMGGEDAVFKVRLIPMLT